MKQGMWRRSRVPIPQALRLAVYARDGSRCRYCGYLLRASEYTLDHVLAHSAGGGDTVDNLVLCCRSCNTRKRNLSAEARRMTLQPAGFVAPQSSRDRRAGRRPGGQP